MSNIKYRPLKTLKEAFIGYIKSCCFMALYVALFRYGLCFWKNTRGKIDRFNPIAAAIVSPNAILLEPSYRRTELALYMLPRFAESFWNFLKKRNLVINVKNGEVLIFSFAMAILMYCYQNEDTNIK